MKKFALLSVVLFTTLTVQSCRQSDELSADEAATLQKVLESSDSLNNTTPASIGQDQPAAAVEDGEIVPPPKK